jgi:hypothetical protein
MALARAACSDDAVMKARKCRRNLDDDQAATVAVSRRRTA